MRKLLSPHLTWEIPNGENRVFLTFDDGPHPEVTPAVLDILDEFNVQASFFCVGDNVRKHPDTYQRLLEKGHATGNHTFNHLNGWKTENELYFNNVNKCAELVDSYLFRPPYGRIKNSQARVLKDHYKIIMWSVLAGDFDTRFSKEDCVKNVLEYTESGSVIVFHDSIKTREKVLYALPRVIQNLSEKGLKFDVISYDGNEE